MKKPLFFKHKPPKEWSEPNYTLQLVLKEDGKTFNLSDPETAEFVYQTTPTRFSDYMQKIAEILGCPKINGGFSGLSWKHYLNPIKHIRWRLTGIWYL